MANLTGNVPLALKVLGSLLDQPSTDPDTIISNLKDALISTLSPLELPVEERVSACINTSYEYLNHEEKIIGQYLANFPGSFSLDAAVGVFSLENTPFYNVQSVMDGLVRRSLLHTNRLVHFPRKCTGNNPDRFQFHRLIREFFLQMNTPDVEESNQHVFFLGFLSYFTSWSMNIADADPTSALEFINQDRHNLLYFLQMIQDSEVLENKINILGIYALINRLYDTKLLQYRFTISELYGPTQSMVEYLEIKCSFTSTRELCYGEHCLATYVSLVLQQAKFEEELGGISRATKLLETHRNNIDVILTHKASEEHCDACQEFFKQLAQHYEDLGEIQEAKVCHENVLSLGDNLRCQPGDCTFADIGRDYYKIGNIRYGVQYMELALEREYMDSVSRANLLATLHLADHDSQQNKEKLLVKALDLYPSLMNESNVVVFNKFDYFSSIVNWLRELGKIDEANSLEEKQLAALSEAGCMLGHESRALQKATALAKEFYQSGKYPKSVSSASLALKLAEKLPMKEKQQIKMEMQTIMFYSQIGARNVSMALTIHETLIEYIHQQNETKEHFSFLIYSCLLLARHGIFGSYCFYDVVGLAAFLVKYIYVDNLPVLTFPTFPILAQMDYFDYVLERSPNSMPSSTEIFLPSSPYHQVEQYVDQAWWMLWKAVLQNAMKEILKYAFRVILVMVYLIELTLFFIVVYIIVLLKCFYYCSFILFGYCVKDVVLRVWRLTKFVVFLNWLVLTYINHIITSILTYLMRVIKH